MHRGAWAALLGIGVVVAAASCGGADAADASSEGQGTGGVLTGVGGGGGASATSTGDAGGSGAFGAGGAGEPGAGGAGGGAPACPPKPPLDGPKIYANDHEWTWVPIQGSKCMDGSQTGIGVRVSSKSDKLFIYLEGGGACFNAETCAIALQSFGKAAFDAWAGSVGQTGIFDDGAADNPVADWNAVYVPYCSGDVHAGAAPNTDVPGGPSGRDFVGYENMGLYLKRLVPTFASATEVLLTGVSAGGFGAAFNYDRVATAFCPHPVVLLDDSGPPMADEWLAPCLQKQWRQLWNFAATIPADCSACTGPDGGGIVHYATYLANKWPHAPMGLVSSTKDAVISTFYGFGSDDCTSATPLSGDQYAAGLEDLRDHYANGPNWGSYFVDSVTHTYLLGPGFYTTSVNGKKLTSWVADLLAGHPGNVGP